MGPQDIPDLPDGAQVNQEEWELFFRQFGTHGYRGAVRMMSRIPSEPRCEACGSPFGGLGGAMMRAMGKGPSRKNPRWCSRCFEMSPNGGATLTIGVLFADIRGSTALAEGVSPKQMADTLNRFYAAATQVIVRHGLVDKLIGDEVMGVYIPALVPSGRFVDAMVQDAEELLCAVGYGSAKGAPVPVGVGLDVGQAFVGNVGDGDITDFTAIGDVVNTAARLQSVAEGGQIVLSAEVAAQAGLDPNEGESVELDLKGKQEPVAARILTIGN